MITRLASVVLAVFAAFPVFAETITVSTADSPYAGDYVADGTCDNIEITQAVAALGAQGGTVEVISGTYDICRDPSNTYGGILIERSNVILDLGTALLRLGDNQNTNVIRILGVGVENVLIRGGRCDGNWDYNTHAEGQYMEANCIRSGNFSAPEYYMHQKNVRVENFAAWDCPRLCAMLWGDGVSVKDSHFGDAGSDVVELLGQHGIIEGNTAEIDEDTGHVFGGDAQGEIIITGNQVRVLDGGNVSVTVFRTYPGHRTILTNNVVEIEPGGRVTNITDLRSYLSTVGNNIINASAMGRANRPPLTFNGGTTLTGNVLQNVFLDLKDDTNGWGAIASGNLLGGLTIPSNITDAGNRVMY